MKAISNPDSLSSTAHLIYDLVMAFHPSSSTFTVDIDSALDSISIKKTIDNYVQAFNELERFGAISNFRSSFNTTTQTRFTLKISFN